MKNICSYKISYHPNETKICFLILYIYSANKQVEVPRPYMIVAHCAKALSTVYDLYLDFDINADSKIAKVS